MSETFFEKIKKIWNWIWYSDSVLSWLVALAVIFIFVKYIFFPILSLIMGTSLPLAGVESSSMDHQIVRDDASIYNLCGIAYASSEISYLDFEEYWNRCGNWYETRSITKKTFQNFYLKNGFKKGDILIVWGRFSPKIGDIIIFTPNTDSFAPRPIVHRIVQIDKNNSKIIIQTKGDHNAEQLNKINNIYKTDETYIQPQQIIGKVIFKIPYMGWLKIWIMEITNKIFGI
ncbi:MAG: hypothetical protein AABX16_00205 [Nanoarchaeota archaeon]